MDPIKRVNINNAREFIDTTINRISQIVDKAIKIGIPMVALFPKTKNNLKMKLAQNHLMKITWFVEQLLKLKKDIKIKIGIMCDVALDPILLMDMMD